MMPRGSFTSERTNKTMDVNEIRVEDFNYLNSDHDNEDNKKANTGNYRSKSLVLSGSLHTDEDNRRMSADLAKSELRDSRGTLKINHMSGASRDEISIYGSIN